jgi:hypothetical protein
MLPSGLGTAPAFDGAGADQIALHVGEAAQHREYQAPGADAGVGLRFRQGSELCACIDNLFDDAEQVEGATGEAVNQESALLASDGLMLLHCARGAGLAVGTERRQTRRPGAEARRVGAPVYPA